MGLTASTVVRPSSKSCRGRVRAGKTLSPAQLPRAAEQQSAPAAYTSATCMHETSRLLQLGVKENRQKVSHVWRGHPPKRPTCSRRSPSSTARSFHRNVLAASTSPSPPLLSATHTARRCGPGA